MFRFRPIALTSAIIVAVSAAPQAEAQVGGGGGGGGGGVVVGGRPLISFSAVLDQVLTGVSAVNAVEGEVDELTDTARFGSDVKRAERFADAQRRRAARQREVRRLRYERAPNRQPYHHNPGYTVPLSYHDYSFLDTQNGLVTGPNLNRHIQQTLGR